MAIRMAAISPILNQCSRVSFLCRWASSSVDSSLSVLYFDVFPPGPGTERSSSVFRLRSAFDMVEAGCVLESDDLSTRSLGRLKNDGAALIDLCSGMGVKGHGATNDFVACRFVFTRKGVQIALQVFTDPDFQTWHGFAADGSGDGGESQSRMHWADSGSLPGNLRKVAGSMGGWIKAPSGGRSRAGPVPGALAIASGFSVPIARIGQGSASGR
jgi:hypothetical protein